MGDQVPAMSALPINNMPVHPTVAMNARLLSSMPDPQRDLSWQVVCHFPNFSKLPPELRQTIWRLTLPKGRQVWLANNQCLRAEADTLKLSPTPIASRVNQESRGETLLHYGILHMPSYIMASPYTTIYASHPVPSWTLCFFDPKADVLLFDFFSVLPLGDSVTPGKSARLGNSVNWVQDLLTLNAARLQTIKSIIINIDYWDICVLMDIGDLPINADQALRHFKDIDKVILRFFGEGTQTGYEGQNKIAMLDLYLECRLMFEFYFKQLGPKAIEVVAVNKSGDSFLEGHDKSDTDL